MRYVTRTPIWGWTIVSFLVSLLLTALVTLVLGVVGIEIYGMRAAMVMGPIFAVTFIVLAIISTGSSIQLERGAILVGQRKKTEEPPLEIPVADIDLTELLNGRRWRIYGLPQAEGKYIESIDPARQPIQEFFINTYKGLTAEVVRKFCRENGITLKEIEWKWRQIDKVELEKRSIKIEYSLKRRSLWKENVVARHREIRSVELVAHDRSPGDDHYMIHMHSGKSYEFGYDHLWQQYNEMKEYTQKHGIPFSVTKK